MTVQQTNRNRTFFFLNNCSCNTELLLIACCLTSGEQNKRYIPVCLRDSRDTERQSHQPYPFYPQTVRTTVFRVVLASPFYQSYLFKFFFSHLTLSNQSIDLEFQSINQFYCRHHYLVNRYFVSLLQITVFVCRNHNSVPFPLHVLSPDFILLK